MKLAYMYATPDVGHSKVTAIQGDLEPTLEHIRRTGYTGVEFLVRDPSVLDAAAIEDAVAKAGPLYRGHSPGSNHGLDPAGGDRVRQRVPLNPYCDRAG